MVSRQHISELLKKYFEACPFCESPSRFKISGIITKSVQCESCLAKWKCEQTPDSEEIMLRYSSESMKATKYNWLLHISRPSSFWATLDEVNTIDWSKTSKEVSHEIKESLILEKEEEILASWVAMTFRDYGIALLTNQRLMWLREEINRKHYLDYAVPLESISQIVQSPHDKRPDIAEKIEILDAHGGAYGLTLERMLKYPSAKSLLEAAIEQRKEKIESKQKQQRVHVLLDFSNLQEYMKKGGMILQTFKCPECGASLKFPKHGSEAICEHCNSSIRAQDIFQKIKELIG